ncbi:MAG: ATP-binding cassette domain-containing protein [Myxococcota bacterium]
MHGLSRFSAAFSPEEWGRLTSFAERVALHAGEVVLRRGDPPKSVYVVESGDLEAVDPRSSPPTVLGRYASGAVLGEMSFLDGAPVSANVRAARDAVVLRFDNAALAAVLNDHPDLDRAFHRGATTTLLERTRELTATTVSELMGRRANTRPNRAFSVGSTAGGHAMKVQGMLSVGFDPHAAVASADQTYEDVSFRVRSERLRIGSGEECEVSLADARIAPVAAELVRMEGGWRVVSTGERAAVVDGRMVSSAPVQDGATIQIGRYALELGEEHIRVEPIAPTVVLEARGLGRSVGDRVVLDDVGFAALSGEVVALIGPSGSGKTTLLNAIRGLRDTGSITLDGRPLESVLAAVPSTLGEVPQDDLLPPELTVDELLDDAARLRLPTLSASERAAAVNAVVEELGLGSVRSSRIGDPERRGISGGQRKRVSIATEVLTPSTRVLFLDEPTSGLDPRSADDIARLARRLADQGRIVLMVTHDTSESVLEQVDHLLVLAPGGRLAWFGPVDEGVEHFRARHTGDLFHRMDDRTPEEWQQAYLASPAHATWVAPRARLLPEGHLKPALEPPSTPIAPWGTQLAVLLRQYARVKLRDRASTAVLVLQPVLVAAVVVLVFPKATAGLVFLVVLACFWFGMSASVRELVADRVVWHRHRKLGMSTSAWVASKALVLGVAVAAQCAFLTGAAHLGAHLGSLGFSLPALAATTVLAGWTGLSLGLAVSALWRRSEAAVGTIVLLLVPQIAFSGVLMPLGEARALARGLSWVTPVRYAYHLALRTGDQLEYLRLGKWYARPVSGELFAMGLRPEGADVQGLPPIVLVAVLVGIGLAAFATAVALESRRRT